MVLLVHPHFEGWLFVSMSAHDDERQVAGSFKATCSGPMAMKLVLRL
jgi:hypothetical protein